MKITINLILHTKYKQYMIITAFIFYTCNKKFNHFFLILIFKKETLQNKKRTAID